MSMVEVDHASNPYLQRPAAVCRHCGYGFGGLVRRGLVFEHRDAEGCAEAQRQAEEGWGE